MFSNSWKKSLLQGFSNISNWNYISDCSGCIHGGYRCSVECYSYPDCSWSDCAFVDQESYCEEWDHNETEGCSKDDGYY